jgi:DUF971 family protein
VVCATIDALKRSRSEGGARGALPPTSHVILPMAGLDKSSALPTRIVVHKQSRALEIEFNDGKVFRLSFEFLRVNSPSAEVRGHGPGQEVLQTGKRDVDIASLEQVGHYAVQPHFSDGHSTGLFSWDYLYHLGTNEASLWADYLRRLQEAGASRDPDAPVGVPLQAVEIRRGGA